MITKLIRTASVFLLAILLLSNGAKAASCHPYIEQLSNGDLKFSVTFTQAQAYVEVFVRQNGIQNIATNIVGSQVQTAAGYTYSYIAPAANYKTGDVIITRFYSYKPNSPGVFTPGPAEQVWSSEFIYNQSCPGEVYVSVNGSDTNPGTITSPVKTITKGMALATANGAKQVKVAAGTYIEGNIKVTNGVSLLGGYSPNFASRDLTFNQYVTTIDANQPTGFAVCGEKRILFIDQVYFETIIEGFVMTRGRLCNFGGGIYIKNSNQLVHIRNNRIINNSSVGNGSSRGGNVYIESSCVQIYNNVITGGFSGGGFGHDLYVESNAPHCTNRIFNNTFSTESALFGLEKTIHFGNSYQTQTRVHVATTGNDANSGTDEAPVLTVAKGIQLAQTKNATQVRIAAGTYVEGNLNVVNGISIYGGYSSDFTAYNPAVHVTTIDAQQPSGFMVCGSKRIFKAENITLPTTISGLTLKGGRLCAYGGGIYIGNSNENLVIQNNKLDGNASVGNGSSNGGNIYIENSSAKILYNTIINGFAGGGYGHDIGINGTYSTGAKTEIAFNTITSPSTIYGGSFANIHDNTYLSGAASAKQATTTSTNNYYLPIEVKLADDVIIVDTDSENISVEVFDTHGRSYVKSQLKEIQLNGLASGIYIVKAASDSYVVTQKVFVK